MGLYQIQQQGKLPPESSKIAERTFTALRIKMAF
jgi:hypothetical protein